MFENKSEAKTELENLGEFGLIKHLTKEIKPIHNSTIKGVGDDAAVIGKNKLKTVITTDMLTEGIHFDLSYVPLKHLGYKAVVVNLSDIYAMNATPKQITVSIALSSRFPLEAIEELYSGIHLACKMYEVDLIGGDTTSSVHGLTISITAIGEQNEEKIVYRSGAKEHDLLVVSGDLGSAFLGLQVLEREKSVFKDNPNIQPDLSGFDYILERQLKPEARKDIVALLSQMDVVPTSMIDVSDGLASEVLHICHESKVGCNVYANKIPVDAQSHTVAEDFKLDPTVCALNGGEDYELLFTISQSDYEKIKGNPHFTIIGHITDENSGANLVVGDGESAVPLTAQGWDAFLSQKNN